MWPKCRLHQCAAGQQVTIVGSAEQTFAYHVSGTRRAHGEDGYCGARILIFNHQSLFQGVQIFGVEDGWQRGTVDRSLGCHGIFTHISCVWYLLGKHNDFKAILNVYINIYCLLFAVSFLCGALYPLPQNFANLSIYDL